jgi:DNA-binding transcriptional MerR regulator
MLRELELPLLEIRDLLEAGSEQQREHLLRHQRRLALRSVEIEHALGRLQTLIEGKEGIMDDVTGALTPKLQSGFLR